MSALNIHQPAIRRVGAGLGRSSQAVSYVLGAALIVLAVASIWTATPARSILEWARDIFGVSFSIFFVMLVFLSVFSVLHIKNQDARSETWRETGMHAASGIATLALTYTLLGISLGIGSLANHDLNPDTINDVIRELTSHFSLAFMTTVVGLPVSALLRAAIGIAWTRRAIDDYVPRDETNDSATLAVCVADMAPASPTDPTPVSPVGPPVNPPANSPATSSQDGEKPCAS